MTLKATVTLCARLPLVPKTVTDPPVVPRIPTEIERVALEDPNGGSVTLVGVIFHWLQVGGHGVSGIGEVVRAIMPPNPLTLVIVIVDVPVVPALIVSEAGFADIVKSASGRVVKLAISMFSGSITPALTTVTHVLPLLVPVHPRGNTMYV